MTAVSFARDISEVRDVVRAVATVWKTNVDDRGHPDALGTVNLKKFINADALLAAAQDKCNKAKQDADKRAAEEHEITSEIARHLVGEALGVTSEPGAWKFTVNPENHDYGTGLHSISLAWKANYDVPHEDDYWPPAPLGMSFRTHYTAHMTEMGTAAYALNHASARSLSDDTALLAIKNIGAMRGFFENMAKATGVPPYVASMIGEYVVLMDAGGKPIELPPYKPAHVA